MKLTCIAKAIGAALTGPDREYSHVSIDTRTVTAEALFFALKGAHFDAHDYIEEALKKGVRAFVVASDWCFVCDLPYKNEITWLQVPDPLQALGRFAQWWRTLFSLPVVGITGSCGKTSTKEMLHTICQLHGKTLSSKGNLNNHIGLPLTLLQLDSTYRYAVLEMGASHMGEIQYLGGCAKPTVGLITNASLAHVEGFGSLANIAKGKGELYEALPQDGVAVLNLEDTYSTYWASRIGKRKTITFGFNKGIIFATDLLLDTFCSTFTLHAPTGVAKVKLNVPGSTMVLNALASSACAFALQIPFHLIIEGLSRYKGVPGRLQRFIGKGGATIFDDSYNANPHSVRAALEVLSHCKGETAFVMGDMAELGVSAVDYHRQVGTWAKAMKIRHFFGVGVLSAYAVEAFGEGGKWFTKQSDLIENLTDMLSSKTVLLIKGSRSAQMDKVIHALKREHIPQEGEL